MNVAAIWKWLVALTLAMWLGLSPTAKALVCAMFVDYVLGCVVAVMTRRLDGHAGWLGLVKKVGTMVLIWLCHKVGQPLGISIDLGEVAALGYLANEMISVVRNAALLGIPVPRAVVDSLLSAKTIKAHRERMQSRRSGLILDEGPMGQAAAGGEGNERGER